MSYDDPDFLECTCTHRALREDEKVQYFVPRPGGLYEQLVFAKGCPIHGYSKNSASSDAEKS